MLHFPTPYTENAMNYCWQFTSQHALICESIGKNGRMLAHACADACTHVHARMRPAQLALELHGTLLGTLFFHRSVALPVLGTSVADGLPAECPQEVSVHCMHQLHRMHGVCLLEALRMRWLRRAACPCVDSHSHGAPAHPFAAAGVGHFCKHDGATHRRPGATRAAAA